MNHRYYTRNDMRLKVVLFSNGVLVASGYTLNISTGGIFLETDYKPDDGHMSIEYEVHSLNRPIIGSHRALALIVHRMPNGLGLMVSENDLEPILQLVKKIGALDDGRQQIWAISVTV